MARRRSVAALQRELNEAQARAAYITNNPGPAVGTQVQSRGASRSLYYRSLIMGSGASRTIYTVNVLAATAAIMTPAQAGLKETLETTESTNRLRGSGVKPTRAHWYRGEATPNYVRSRYGTTYARTYVQGSHRSMPFSIVTGDFSADDLADSFRTLFFGSGALRSQLGAANGRAYLEFERAPISENT